MLVMLRSEIFAHIAYFHKENFFSVQVGPPANVFSYTCMTFLVLMTFTFNGRPWYTNLTWVYLHTKNGVSRSRLSKVKVRARAGQTDRHKQTDAAECITTPHSRVVNCNSRTVNVVAKLS